MNAVSVTDIHSSFVIWFTWGFVFSVSPLILTVLVYLFWLISKDIAVICGNFCFSILGCVSVGWWIIGLVLRFDSVGRYSVGDVPPVGTDPRSWSSQVRATDSIFQTASGNFMLIYFVTSFVVLAAALVTGIILLLLYCFVGPSKEESTRGVKGKD